jgi:hypothetical protein
MRRPIIFIALVLVTLNAFAQERRRPSVPPSLVSGATVSGVATAVSGNLIQLANGLVTIDASGATIRGADDATTTIAAIHVGDLIFAALKPGDVAANAPLPAAFIGVTSLAAVTLTGPVTSVNATNGTLTLLGRTVHVNAATVFSGLRPGESLKLGDIVPNEIVSVDANVSGGVLVATAVHVFAPVPMPAALIRGTVKSISNTSWVVTSNSKDITIVINAQTKIAGNPKVGDTVDVVTATDSANNYVALTIIAEPQPPTSNGHIRGIVKAITPTAWTVASEVMTLLPGPINGPDIKLLIDSNTKIVGDPKVGDRVDAVVQIGNAGYTAISITKITP